MKCIDDELIQKYIDGETMLKEEAFINEHISCCEKCREKVDCKREQAKIIKKAISLIGENAVESPEFLKPGPQKKMINTKLKRYIYPASAACILILIFFFYQNQKRPKNKEINILYNLESEYDANLPLSEQEMVIQIIDSKGKLTTY